MKKATRRIFWILFLICCGMFGYFLGNNIADNQSNMRKDIQKSLNANHSLLEVHRATDKALVQLSQRLESCCNEMHGRMDRQLEGLNTRDHEIYKELEVLKAQIARQEKRLRLYGICPTGGCK